MDRAALDNAVQRAMPVRGMDFNGWDLRGADLSATLFEDCSFEGAALNDAETRKIDDILRATGLL